MEKDTVLEKGMLMGRVFCKYSETLQLVLGLDTKYPTFFIQNHKGPYTQQIFKRRSGYCGYLW